MPTCNVSLQIVPLMATREQSYALVDRVIAMIAESGVPHEVGPMETVMEGELPDLLDIVRRAHELCSEAGAAESLSAVKVHYRVDGVTMHEKTDKFRS